MVNLNTPKEVFDARRIAKAAVPPEVYAHTLRVVERIKGDTVVIWVNPEMVHETVVAYLHDVLEDSDLLVADLIDYGFNGLVVDAVEVLTRHELVTYAEYIERVKHYGGAAKAVKIADLEDHLAEVETLKPSLKRRYEKALAILTDPEGWEQSKSSATPMDLPSDWKAKGC
jgi:(p)ppGpp synthase/HD superfamily hydrolase